jgi:hypothetical protein
VLARPARPDPPSDEKRIDLLVSLQEKIVQYKAIHTFLQTTLAGIDDEFVVEDPDKKRSEEMGRMYAHVKPLETTHRITSYGSIRITVCVSVCVCVCVCSVDEVLMMFLNEVNDNSNG